MRHPFCVARINLTVPRGCLLAVVGPVGAGKSSLLSALLGELSKLEGSVSIQVRPRPCPVYWNIPHPKSPPCSCPLPTPSQAPLRLPPPPGPSSLFLLHVSLLRPHQPPVFQGPVAYVPQEAWVQNTSVVENVCFGQELDPLWLERVLEACALWPDVGSLPAGIHTQAGEQVRVRGLLGAGRH